MCKAQELVKGIALDIVLVTARAEGVAEDAVGFVGHADERKRVAVGRHAHHGAIHACRNAGHDR